ncbi:MAG TPA: hypothetical protein DF480_00300, partial [Clostridiales bacterium]|nr:hypothetical protein [Clostridiales bacterium]
MHPIQWITFWPNLGIKEGKDCMSEKKYFTRMGDGSIVYMTAEEIWEDLRAGMDDAVDRGKIPPLSEDELQKIYDIVTMPGGVVGV